jgi:hypothetical protein
VCTDVAAAQGGVLHCEEDDRGGIDLEPFFQVGAVLAEVAYFFLSCSCSLRLPLNASGVLSWALTRAWKSSFGTRVLVGEVPAFDARLRSRAGRR